MADCCICLQAFDEDDHVPRVLACGHSLCDECLERLVSNRDLRCPECGHLTRLATIGSLPKNIELLRLIDDRRTKKSTGRIRTTGGIENRGFLVLQNLGFFASPGFESCFISRAASNSSSSLSYGDLCFSRGGTEDECRYSVSLLELWESDNRDRLDYRKSAYTKLGLKIWQNLSHECRKELQFVSRLNTVCTRVCRVLGFWLSEQGKLYLVNKVSSQRDISSVDGDDTKRMDVALRLSEVFMELHTEGMVCGIFGPECFHLDDFRQVFFHWNAAFDMRNKMHGNPLEGMQQISAWQYTSPEMLQWLSDLRECSNNIGSRSDAWSLACYVLQMVYGVPCRILSFKQACDEALQPVTDQTQGTLPSDESETQDSLQLLLRKCLAFEPEERGNIANIWNELQLVASPECKVSEPLERLVQGNIWCFGLKPDEPVYEVPESHSEEKMSLPKTMEGHTGYITSLAIFGKMLVSASYDKTVRVWSLQDGAQFWRWEGHHSQRILAGAADQSSQIFFTGDYGKTICAWKISEPFDPEPIITWQEHSDWRFTGVSALAVSTNGFLYSGSGDRTIKVWSLKDYTHVGTLEGHKSVVSSIVIDGELLYSGSWDGSIRLWDRKDHSCVSVLRNDYAGPVRSLAVIPENNMVVSSHEDGSVQVWEDGCRLYGARHVHEETVNALAYVGGLLVTASWDQTIKAWHVDQMVHGDESNPAIEIKTDAPIMSLIVSHDKQRILASSTKIQTYQL